MWDYVLTAEGALDALELTEAPLVLVGHSHVALAIGIIGGTLDGGLALRAAKWISPVGAGSSIQARWVSRATATLGPPI